MRLRARIAAALAAASAAAVAAFALQGRAPSPLGLGETLREGVDRNPENLLPAFRQRLERVFEDMRAAGFSPLLWEGYRTPERARKLAAGGVGIERSLHTLGAAADVVDAVKLWNASPAFWEALAHAARANGLTSGSDFGDPPHVQAVPVAKQSELRAAADKDSYLRRLYA